MKRALIAFISTCLIAVGILSASASTANAVTLRSTQMPAVYFKKTTTSYSKRTNTCVQTTVTGYVRATRKEELYNSGITASILEKVRLTDLRVSLKTFSGSCSSPYPKLKTVKSLQSNTSVNYTSCVFTTSIGVGVPFSVGVSWTPSCGSRSKTYMAGTGHDRSTYSLFDTDQKVTLPRVVNTAGRAKACFTIGTTGRVELRSGVSDSFRGGYSAFCVYGY